MIIVPSSRGGSPMSTITSDLVSACEAGFVRVAIACPRLLAALGAMRHVGLGDHHVLPADREFQKIDSKKRETDLRMHGHVDPCRLQPDVRVDLGELRDGETRVDL